MRELSFQMTEADGYYIGFSEGIFKLVSLLDKPIHKEPHEAIKVIVQKARRDFDLKFLPSENPFVEAIEHDNIFKITIGNVHIVFTAAHYQEKDTIFVFLWEELDAQIPDGQNKFKKKWYNLPR